MKISQVTGEASHLSGYTFSAHNNIIHPSAELGSKTTVWFKLNQFERFVAITEKMHSRNNMVFIIVGGSKLCAGRGFTNG